jgi:hypothetical protein
MASIENNEKQEFSLTVGELSGSNPNEAGLPLSLGGGVGVEFNFARKIRDSKYGSLYWEVDVLGGPVRYLQIPPITHDVHSAFVAPGLKLQFAQNSVWSPWIAAGAGYAFYDTSGPNISGASTATSWRTNTYAADFGAGVDFVVRPHLVLRGDFRGYYTGGPNLGVGTSSGQLNFTLGGGIVWRFAK